MPTAHEVVMSIEKARFKESLFGVIEKIQKDYRLTENGIRHIDRSDPQIPKPSLYIKIGK